jgi:hypothetical protein
LTAEEGRGIISMGKSPLEIVALIEDKPTFEIESYSRWVLGRVTK